MRVQIKLPSIDVTEYIPLVRIGYPCCIISYCATLVRQCLCQPPACVCGEAFDSGSPFLYCRQLQRGRDTEPGARRAASEISSRRVQASLARCWWGDSISRCSMVRLGLGLMALCQSKWVSRQELTCMGYSIQSDISMENSQCSSLLFI